MKISAAHFEVNTAHVIYFYTMPQIFKYNDYSVELIVTTVNYFNSARPYFHIDTMMYLLMRHNFRKTLFLAEDFYV